jgi:Ca2+-binding RTX toxin-like protein
VERRLAGEAQRRIPVPDLSPSHMSMLAIIAPLFALTTLLAAGSLAQAKVVLGGPDDDRIVGTEEDDTLIGGPGEDSIRGLQGEDELFGGTGDDSGGYVERGGKGLFGGRGADKLYGNGGGDDLTGGEGADLLRGGNGDDTVYDSYDGPDRDRIFCGEGRDWVFADEEDFVDEESCEKILRGAIW